MKSSTNFYKQLIRTFIISKSFSERLLNSAVELSNKDKSLFVLKDCPQKECFRIAQKILRESFINCGNDLEIVVDALAQTIGSTTGLERILKPLCVSLSLSAVIETDSTTLWIETMECLKRSVESYKALLRLTKLLEVVR
jgi:hypothetical protein